MQEKDSLKRDSIVKTALFIGISVLYFLIFIAPNLKGAQNASMLAVFEIDEFAQYPHLIEMLTPGATFYQSLRNFLIYQHYFYGYPFYFISAVFALPEKFFLGGSWPINTPVIVASLRQLVNVAPMIVSIFLLVYMQTRLRPLWKSVGLFVFLLSLPAVIGNNLWWHPDSLQVLSGILVLFFLDRDDLRFGKNFLFSAAVCGVAAGIKYAGLFFFLVIPVYIVWGLIDKRISFRKAIFSGLEFVGIMVITLILTNPLLLLPQERAEVISNQLLQFQQTSLGILQTNPEPYFNWGSYPEDFRIHYGEFGFILIALAALVYGILRPGEGQSQRRRLLVLILAWIIPTAITINFSATRRTYYFLPVILPLFSCLAVLPFEKIRNLFSQKPKSGWSSWGWLLLAGVIVLQAILFIRTDVEKYRQALTREKTSTSIAFYKTLDSEFLPKIRENKLVIYRDWHVYFPSQSDREVEMSWEMVSYDFINPIHPDLILLDRENLNLFSQAESVERAVDPQKMLPVYQFYRDAKSNQIPGYSLLYENSFGLAFVKTGLRDKYFK
jgi:hypothetical protein